MIGKVNIDIEGVNEGSNLRDRAEISTEKNGQLRPCVRNILSQVREDMFSKLILRKTKYNIEYEL